MKEKEILQTVKDRMGIEALNEMQCRALDVWKSGRGDLARILLQTVAKKL